MTHMCCCGVMDGSLSYITTKKISVARGRNKFKWSGFVVVKQSVPPFSS
jgi:hypothetical protein